MKRILLPLLFSGLLQACSVGYDTASATISFRGDPAVDGCGWVVDIGETSYKAITLDEAYLIDGLEVEIKYKVLSSKAPCARIQDVFEEIDIKKME